jgi:quercetin dioxygenase-like cupin family protein
MSAGNPGIRRSDPVVAVDHHVENRTPWGYMQWMCNGTLFADAQQTFGYVEINPGQKNPRHLHPNSDEVLYLLEGELEHSLGDALHHLEAGMAIHIPQGVPHDAMNRGASVARMLVAYPTADRQVVMCEEGQE